jgi:hypothetical protein
MEWFNLAQNGDNWWALVNKVMNLRVGGLSSTCVIGSM